LWQFKITASKKKRHKTKMQYLKPLTLAKEKGVAGIEILIEIVIGLFVLGVLVFSITLMGSEIQDQDTIGNDSKGIINDTYQAIGQVVDWFPIIIIFGAIVVLILLTVLIIRTVKTSGYGGGGA